MPTKFLNISTDNTLGGISPSDETVSSQKAIKNYVDGVIPTVNDATITITQGGVTKGSFTLNQASGDTIALDAGGGGSSLDAGFLCAFAGSTAPAGWLVCDGSAVSRTNYSSLFTAIGTTYGSGDGSTTFNLPDLSDCFVQGGTPGTTHTAGAPNITGSYFGRGLVRDGDYTTATGALYYNTGVKYGLGSNSYIAQSSTQTDILLDASRSSSVYGGSSTIQPKSVEMLWCIKY